MFCDIWTSGGEIVKSDTEAFCCWADGVLPQNKQGYPRGITILSLKRRGLREWMARSHEKLTLVNYPDDSYQCHSISELPNKPGLSPEACKKKKKKTKGHPAYRRDTPPQVGSSGQVGKRLEETSPPEVATAPGHSLSLSSKQPQLSLFSEPCVSLGRPLLGFHRAVW